LALGAGSGMPAEAQAGRPMLAAAATPTPNTETILPSWRREKPRLRRSSLISSFTKVVDMRISLCSRTAALAWRGASDAYICVAFQIVQAPMPIR
jgi:hypothetical protein